MAMTAPRMTVPLQVGEEDSMASYDIQRTPQKRAARLAADETRGLRMASQGTSSGQNSGVRVVSTPKAKAGVRDHKVPQGPRPAEFAGKRVFSDNSTASSATPRRTYLPNATSEPFLGLSARRKTAQYSAATAASSRRTVAAAPRTDSLQQAADPFTLTTPASRNRILSGQHVDAARSIYRDGQSLQGSGASSRINVAADSPARRRSTALRAAQLSMPGVAKPVPATIKHQNYLPPPPTTESFDFMISSENVSPVKDNVSKIGQPSLQTPRIRTTSGIARTASTKLPTRVGAPPPNDFADDTSVRRLPRMQDNKSRTPSNMQLAAPQSTLERRLSSASAHSGGLLARTVSPTDTKRKKKTSGHGTTRSPTPELTFGASQQINGNSSHHGQSDFSHDRMTPEHQLKSMSSRSSLASFRTPGSSTQSRPTPAGQVSRSSSTRSRTTYSSTGEKVETVPPVPAIPKAFESPRGVIEGADFVFSDFGPEELRLDDPHTQSSNRHQYAREAKTTRLMAPAYAMQSQKDSMHSVQPANHRLSQQVRLAPLNLQPLSEATSAKIASFASPEYREDSNRGSTPPVRKTNKTPSTPMTASKASFSGPDPRFAYAQDPLPQLRSTTSYGGDARTLQFSREQSENSSPSLFATPSSSIPHLPQTDTAAANSTAHSVTGSPRITNDEFSRASKTPTSPLPKALASAAARLSLKPGSGVAAYADATNPGKPRLVSINKASTNSLASTLASTTSLAGAQSTKEVPTQGKSNTGPLSPVRKMLASRTSRNLLRNQASRSFVDADEAAGDEEMIKLGAKKKGFESAAKEVDDLTKRAYPRQAISASQACRTEDLNIFERGEIIDYKDIYFCGAKDARKYVGDLASQSVNFGFDDDRGDYNIVLRDHLAYRYEVVDILGKGSFGQVVRCIDHRTGKLVAVKIIRNKKRFHQQALVEVNILQKLKDWDPNDEHGMVSFTQSFYFRGHLCISTELLSMNLYEFIKAHEFRGFSLRLIRRFTKQLLGSLCLLQTKNVIHCDMKPENILLAHPLQSKIKVIDFGSSCFDNERVYTYIQSRFYRSPEVILGMNYGMPIDMWSLGCILAELYTGYPIFPGENEQEQLACIMEVFGPPEKHLVEQSTRKKLFFDSMGKPRLTVSTKGKRRRPSTKTLQQTLKCDDEAFLDFIAKCLRWDPERRLKPDEAMQHDFVTGLKKRPNTVASTIANFSSSPAKRHTLQAPLRIRPLPEAPTYAKNSVGMPFGSARTSPTKGQTMSRRHSVINGLSDQTSKRGSVSSGVGTTMAPPPAPVVRNSSSKMDMAASAASFVTRPR